MKNSSVKYSRFSWPSTNLQPLCLSQLAVSRRYVLPFSERLNIGWLDRVSQRLKNDLSPTNWTRIYHRKAILTFLLSRVRTGTELWKERSKTLYGPEKLSSPLIRRILHLSCDFCYKVPLFKAVRRNDKSKLKTASETLFHFIKVRIILAFWISYRTRQCGTINDSCSLRETSV